MLTIWSKFKYRCGRFDGANDLSPLIAAEWINDVIIYFCYWSKGDHLCSVQLHLPQAHRSIFLQVQKLEKSQYSNIVHSWIHDIRVVQKLKIRIHSFLGAVHDSNSFLLSKFSLGNCFFFVYPFARTNFADFSDPWFPVYFNQFLIIAKLTEDRKKNFCFFLWIPFSI